MDGPFNKKGSAGKRTSLRDLAEHLSLSKTTVSVVLSGSPAAEAIPAATRDRIFRGAARLGYRPHYIARSLRKSSTMSVGIITPDFSDGYFTHLMSGIESYLLSREYFYFTVSHSWKPALIEQYTQMLAERGVDGLILINTPVPQSSLPMVAISGRHLRKGPPTVSLNHTKAADLVMEHLYSLGHRRIAMMRGQSSSQDTDLRWKAFVTAARKLDIPLDPRLQVTLNSSVWSADWGYSLVRELLDRTRDFTAIVCFNDITAMGAIRAFRDTGLRVPEDVSVVGFDDVINAGFFSPSITTIHQPLRKMGYSAAERLIQSITDPPIPVQPTIIHEPTLVVRESTGPAAVLKVDEAAAHNAGAKKKMRRG